MPQERTEAVVLRGVDFSESSRIVTFLTPDRGRLACLAKGARRRKSAVAAALDTFNRVELVYYWKDGRGVQNLSEAALLDAYSGIKNNLEKGVYAAFALEFVAKVAHENEPSRELYAALTGGLASMAAWPGDARTHVCWQLLRFLREAGFEPVLDRCVKTGEAVSDTPGFVYEGGVVAAGCRADRRLSRETYAVLRVLSAARDACPDVRAPDEAFTVLRLYAARQLETEFRSVRVIEEMFGKGKPESH